mgnify:CR=1 FL=1
MLDQNDLKLIKDIVDSSIAPLKDDMAFLKHDIALMKQDITSIKTEMGNFHSDLMRIEAKIDRMMKMETEDVTVVSNEVQILKQKYIELERQVKVLQQQHTAN